MNWTVTKVFAFTALLIGAVLTYLLDDGNIFIGTMASCGIILGAKNLPRNEK